MADEWKRTALLVLGMQNDYIKDGLVASIPSSKAIVPNVIKAVEIARQRGILVVWVVREHDQFGRDVEPFRRHRYQDGRIGPVIKGTKGAEIVDGLEIKDEDYKVVKTRFSAFFGTNLNSFLQGAGITNVVIVGIQTPNCVRQTVFDAVAHNYKSVTAIMDATVSRTPEIQVANFLDMKNIKVKTPTVQEWCEDDA